MRATLAACWASAASGATTTLQVIIPMNVRRSITGSPFPLPRAGEREDGLLAGDGLDGVAGDRDHPVELGLGDDERRREEDALHARPCNQPALGHLLHEPRPDLLVGI